MQFDKFVINEYYLQVKVQAQQENNDTNTDNNVFERTLDVKLKYQILITQG